MDRLADAWSQVEKRVGFETESPTSPATLSWASPDPRPRRRNNPKFDQSRAVALVAEGTVDDFFPTLGPRAKRPWPGPAYLQRRARARIALRVHHIEVREAQSVGLALQLLRSPTDVGPDELVKLAVPGRDPRQ